MGRLDTVPKIPEIRSVPEIHKQSGLNTLPIKAALSANYRFCTQISNN